MKLPPFVWTQWAAVIAAIMLGFAPLSLPIGYYTALRIVVFIICTLLVWREKLDTDPHLWSFVFIAIGILFNPVVPIYLRDKLTWTYLDIACAAVFGAYVLHPIIIRRQKLR